VDRAPSSRRRPAAVGSRADVRARPQHRLPRPGWRLAGGVHDRLRHVRRAAGRGGRAAQGAAAAPGAVAGGPRRPAGRHQPAHAPAHPDHEAGPLERARPALPLRLISAVPGVARWSARRSARALAVPEPDPRILAGRASAPTT
jgi:hypothetical protein